MPPQSSSRSDRAFGRRCILAAAVLWSLSGVFTKSLTGLDGGTIAVYRGLFAGLALLPLVRPAKMRFQKPMIPLVVTFAAMTGLFLGAMKATTAANTIFLQYSSALWAVPLSMVFLREWPDRRSLWCIAVAAFGIVLIVVRGGGGGENDSLGIAMALGSGVAYAGVAVGLRSLRGLDPMWLSSVNNLGGALVLGLFLLLVSGSIPLPTWPQAGALLLFGIVQMAIPYVLFARGLRDVPAPEAGLLALVEPLLNPLWVLIFINEWPKDATLIGGAFLLAGVALRYIPLKRPRPVSITPDPAAPPASPADPARG
ncbi:EamA family transporter [Tautonia sp. JC769]|uniref:DMT family transporter n=1 Tax=Tautonia sp. JC769 TaxID=3232135 RepID=UPI00345A2CB3